MARILIVDNGKYTRARLAAFFESRGHNVLTAKSGPQALTMLSKNAVDLVITDYRMVEVKGSALLRQLRHQAAHLIIVSIAGHGGVENAATAIEAGADDYPTEPFTLDQIQHVVERALEMRRPRAENRILHEAVEDQPLLHSKSPAMLHLLESAERAASSEATILLTGESGTGKNVLARQIHRWSARRERAFIVVNCTTLSEHLLESDLFGHVKGAFTGAVNNKPGRLEAANGGTVFFDKIADLSPPLQAKFLRFIEDHCFERLGGHGVIRVDSRIVVASNRSLESEVAAHHFRKDLFYRLNVVALHVPALRERPEDIASLARYFLRAAAARYQRPELRLSCEALVALARYRWPGNVRELHNTIKRAVALGAGDDLITPYHLPDSVLRDLREPAVAADSPATFEERKREQIGRALAESLTLEDAANRLGISPSTLWRRRKRYKIDISSWRLWHRHKRYKID